jgi:adenosine deaminase
MLTVELHRHFEAGIGPETIARLAVRHGLTEVRTRSGAVVPDADPQDAESIRRYYNSVANGFGAPDGFPRFTDSFGLPLSALRSLEDLEDAILDQLVDCAERGSLHTELRGSPFTYQEHIDAPVEEIAIALVRGVDRAWAERTVSGTFVLAFSRQKGLGPPDAPPVRRQAAIVARLAAELHRRDRPVGLDIAGFPETTYPPRAFEEALAPAREAGVPLTVHAGEQGRPADFLDAPPELIVEAVERLGARRIGHGTSLAASSGARRLMREMGFMPIADHPLPLLLREGLIVSLSTDDPLMFGPFTVAETFDAIAGPLGLNDADLLALTHHGIASAFVTETRRAWLRQQLEDRRKGA